MAALRVGTDFSGCDMPLFAIQKLRIPYCHIFSSDCSPACRKLIEGLHKPTRFYDYVEDPKHRSDTVDLYCIGPPCQPFSPAGLNKGDEDPRSLVDHSLQYISDFKPAAVMMENVANLASAKHKSTLDRILHRLHESGYKTKRAVLNTAVHGGVGQNRRRLYLVAVRKDKVVQGRPFRWPGTLRRRRLPLDPRIPADDPNRLPAKDWARGRPRSLVKRSIRQCLAKGVNPRRTVVFTDVGCTKKRARHMVNIMPCLTRNRGLSGGYWVSTRGRLTTISELFRFQGLSPTAIRFRDLDISEREMGGILGNSMSLPICGRVIRQLLHAAGLLSGELPRDPWERQ